MIGASVASPDGVWGGVSAGDAGVVDDGAVRGTFGVVGCVVCGCGLDGSCGSVADCANEKLAAKAMDATIRANLRMGVMPRIH